MGNPRILHMITPLKHMSPFDVNMALDAGFDAAIPYTNVTTEDVTGLVQDAIFSRGPEGVKRTGVFIGGKRAIEALDMMDRAKKAMVPPFEISVFADPAGSFTTAAAMVALAKKALRDKFSTTLKGKRIAVFGGTGVVAFASAVIAAVDGASSVLIGYDGPERVRKLADEARARFGVDISYADGSTEKQKTEIARDADIIFAAGPAGKRLLTLDQLKQAKRLKVASRRERGAALGRRRRGSERRCQADPGNRRGRHRRARCRQYQISHRGRTVRKDDRIGKAGLSRLPRRLRPCPEARRLKLARF